VHENVSKLFSGKCSVALVIITRLLCAGPADEWLHHPAFKGGGESGSRHEEDSFRILTEVRAPECWSKRMHGDTADRMMSWLCTVDNYQAHIVGVVVSVPGKMWLSLIPIKRVTL